MHPSVLQVADYGVASLELNKHRLVWLYYTDLQSAYFVAALARQIHGHALCYLVEEPFVLLTAFLSGCVVLGSQNYLNPLYFQQTIFEYICRRNGGNVVNANLFVIY